MAKNEPSHNDELRIQRGTLDGSHNANTRMYRDMLADSDVAYEALKTQARIDRALSELAGGPARSSATLKAREMSALRNELGDTERQHERFADNVDYALAGLARKKDADEVVAENMSMASGMLTEAEARSLDGVLAELVGDNGTDRQKINMGIRKMTGITNQKVNEIIKTPKGVRPDPTTYLSSKYIKNHLLKFKNRVTKIVALAPTGTAGPPSGTFVMPSNIADDLIAKAGGDVLKLEQLLGLKRGSLGTNPVRIDIPNPTGLRLPSGNELGANSQWIPGGYTAGGLLEAIIDSPKWDSMLLP